MLRIAVVSPFLDKQHGTERCVLEQVERLARDGFEVHLYCQRVSDIPDLKVFKRGGMLAAGAESTNRIVWHRVPSIPGPHLLGYVWWFLANHAQRWKDRKFRKLQYDLVYSPGINCLDADAIVVHIVFQEFYRLVIEDLRLRQLPLRAVPRAIHRRLYYQLAMALERRIYTNPRVAIAAVSKLTADEVERYSARHDVRIIPNAVELACFNPEARLRQRADARRQLQLDDEDFVLLLVGNDWKKKGVDALLKAAARCLDLPCKLLIVGHDDRLLYGRIIDNLGLQDRVQFVELSENVVQFYGAADAYVGPSLHDSFAFPPAEAMACGLPVITTRNNGGSQMITDGVDGFLLQDATDSEELSNKIRRLYENPTLRAEVGRRAAIVAKEYTWERNTQQIRKFLEDAYFSKKPGHQA